MKVAISFARWILLKVTNINDVVKVFNSMVIIWTMEVKYTFLSALKSNLRGIDKLYWINVEKAMINVSVLIYEKLNSVFVVRGYMTAIESA